MNDLPFLPPPRPRLPPGGLGLLVNLPFPVSTNAIWRKGNGRTFLSKQYVAWKKEADQMAMGQRHKKVSGPFYAFIVLDATRRPKSADVDNFAKGILDWLQRVELIDNDKLAESVTISWGQASTGCSVVVYPARVG